MSRKHSTTQVTVREASQGSEASETTPLVPSDVNPNLAQAAKSWFPPIARVLFTSFLLSMTFAFTQTSLIYSFRTMTCDEYYKTHASPEMDLLGVRGNGDRCAVPAIESSTARSIALMGSTTTASTIINLFVTGYWIKRFGVKAAMFQQTAWAAGRNLCQIYSLHLGGAGGIRIIQITQLFNIMGSGGGYMLASNAFIAILADADKRTSLFGVLGGIAMLGASAGYTFGGLTEYFFGPIAPFQVTFCLLVFCTIFGSIFLPHIRPGASSSNSPGKKSQSFLAPLKIFIPRRVTDERGSRRDWNLFLVGLGAFFSVLATGYVPLGLQLVATNVFGFKPAESGAMLSLTLLVKAFFLSICFPVIISRGRGWVSGHRPAVSSPHPARKLSSSSSSSTSSSSTHPHPQPRPTSSSSSTLTAVDQSNYGSIDPHSHPDQPLQAQEPNVSNPPTLDQPPRSTDQAHGSLFDLHFLRWSIFLDGILTACVSWSSAGWHMYLAAAILPFASGTGSACKGVTLDFVDEHDRGDALGAIALVEKLAQVLTVGIFGTIFSALSEAEKPTMVFLANAVVAMLGFGFLLFVKLPTPRQPSPSSSA